MITLALLLALSLLTVPAFANSDSPNNYWVCEYYGSGTTMRSVRMRIGILVVLFSLSLAVSAQTYSTTFQSEPAGAGLMRRLIQLAFHPMKRTATLLALLAAVCLYAAQAQTIDSYTTSLPLTENPISENGNWLNGKTNGIDWNDCQTMGGSPGFASGTQPGTGQYNDSICVLTGTFSAAQSAAVTVHVAHSIGAQYDEVEAHVNTTIIAGKITGYEGYCPIAGSSTDPMQIVRWNGPLANATNSNNGFTVLKGLAGVTCTTGDVVKLSNDGTGNLTLSKNGTAEITFKDATYLGGSPGMGFYIQNLDSGATAASAAGAFGASGFTATGLLTSGGSGGGGTTPAPTVTVSWTAAAPGTDPAVSYNIYRGSVKIGLTAGTSYIDSNVMAGATYTSITSPTHRCFGHRKRAFEFSYCTTIPAATQQKPKSCTNRRYSYPNSSGA